MTIESDALTAAVSAALTQGEMDAVRIHEFQLDGDEHDDKAIEQLHESFHADFETALSTIAQTYGQPNRTESDCDDDAIPLCGSVDFRCGRLTMVDSFSPYLMRIATRRSC